VVGVPVGIAIGSSLSYFRIELESRQLNNFIQFFFAVSIH